MEDPKSEYRKSSSPAFAGMTLLFLFAVTLSHAAEKTAARFLKLPAGAREVAIGAASSALTNDVNSIHSNPAGLAGVRAHQMGLTHGELSIGSRSGLASFALPARKSAFGLSAFYLDHGSQEGRDENREKTAEFSSSDVVYSLAAARSFARGLSLGAAFKGFESRIGPDQARSFALDGGGQLTLGPRGATRLALSFQNAGPSVTFLQERNPLPLLFSAGLAQHIYEAIFISGEWSYEPRERKRRLSIGTEAAVGRALFLRAGYGGSPGSLSPHIGVVGGIGINISNFRLDYAFYPADAAQDGHRLSLLFNFSSPSSVAPRAPAANQTQEPLQSDEYSRELDLPTQKEAGEK